MTRNLIDIVKIGVLSKQYLMKKNFLDLNDIATECTDFQHRFI